MVGYSTCHVNYNYGTEETLQDFIEILKEIVLEGIENPEEVSAP